jgi:hypothetical protein
MSPQGVLVTHLLIHTNFSCNVADCGEHEGNGESEHSDSLGMIMGGGWFADDRLRDALAYKQPARGWIYTVLRPSFEVRSKR